jgi:FG-GAP-like repeat
MTSVRVPDFSPTRNGLHFLNSWPAIPDYTLSILGQNITLGSASNGLCGGMAYTVNDLFLTGLLPPPDTTNPAGGTPLFNYIVARLTNSFDPPDFLQYLSWIQMSDHDTWFSHGLAWHEINEEWPAIKSDLDAGRPSPLGLVHGQEPPTVGFFTGLQDLGECHQVLAWGYDLNGTSLTIHIYDPDNTGDANTITLDIGNSQHTTPISVSNWAAGTFRGFFRTRYVYHDPRTPASGAFIATVVTSPGISSAGPLVPRTNIALTGGPGWATIPVAFSHGDGTFNVTNDAAADFASWAQTPNVQVLVGDFNGDGHMDLALTGGAGWATIPVAFSNGDGTFRVTNQGAPDFPGWAQGANVRVLVGDFNGDGRADLALVGGAGWATVPVAFSNGDGTFRITNQGVPNFPSWAQAPNVKVLAGDFNGDGRTDLALTGGPAWATIPVAFSNGDGTFNVTNQGVPSFPAWAQGANVQVHLGDFNRDGRTDLALTGGAAWTTLPVAFSNGNGTFNVTNQGVAAFPGWAQGANVRVHLGDFNRDGRTDLALTGGAGWATVPVAFSNGDGTFSVTNQPAGDFPSWADTAGVKVLVGDFNGDGRTDLALTGGPGWASVPVAFSNGDGTFRVTNQSVPDFPGWAQAPNVAPHPIT